MLAPMTGYENLGYMKFMASPQAPELVEKHVSYIASSAPAQIVN